MEEGAWEGEEGGWCECPFFVGEGRQGGELKSNFYIAPKNFVY